MAKSEEDINLDDLNLDEFDLGSPDYDAPPTAGGRTPITEVADTFKDAAKKEIVSKNTLGRLIKKSLPEGYRDVVDRSEEVAGEAQDLYNSASEKLAPAKRIAKKKGRQLLPKVRGYLPDSVAKRLEDLLEPDQVKARAPTIDEQRDEQIKLAMGDIFGGVSSKLEETKDAAIDAQNQQTRLGAKQHQQNIKQLSKVETTLNRLAAYQDNVTSRYQRKSLELQYRQLFVSRDMLDSYRRKTERGNQLLEGILSNTGLPDVIKMRTMEAAAGMARGRFLEFTQNRVINSLGGLVGNVKENLQRQLGGFVGGVNSSLEQADMMSEMTEGLSKTDMAASAGAGMLGDQLTSRLGRRIGSALNRNRFIRSGSARVMNAMEGAPTAVQDWAATPEEAGINAGLFRRGRVGLTNWARSLVDDPEREGVALEDPVSQLEDTVQFNALTRRSITEVIPGYLSKILWQITVLRTGDESAPEVAYDFSRSNFSTRSGVRSATQERVLSRTAVSRTQGDLDSLVGTIDRENKLSPEAREGLERQLLTDARRGRGLKLERYTDTNYFDDSVSEEARAEISGLVGQRFAPGSKKRRGDTETADETLRVGRAYRGLMDTVPGVSEEIARQIALGNQDYVDELDLLNHVNGQTSLNADKIIEILLDRAYSEGTGYDSTSTSDGENPRTPNRQPASNAGGYSGSNSARATDSNAGLADEQTQGENGGSGSLEGSRSFLRDTSQSMGERVRALDLGGRFQSAGARAGEYLKGAGGAMHRGYSSLNIGDRARQLSTRVGSLYGQARESLGAIYVRGKQTPALLGERLAAGEYRDQVTGRVIRGISDIRNAVVDGTGRVVLRAQDIARGLRTQEEEQTQTGTYATQYGLGIDQAKYDPVDSTTQPWSTDDIQGTSSTRTTEQQDTTAAQALIDSGMPSDVRQARMALETIQGMLEQGISVAGGDGETTQAAGKRGLFGGIKSGVGNAFSGVGRFYGGIYGGLGNILRGGGGLAGGAMRMGGNVLGRMGKGRVSDVYVRGNPVPVLLGRDIKRGLYSDMETGEPIRSIDDIQNPVVDEEGDVVLTALDLERGIYDKQGEPLLRSAYDAVTGFYGKLLSPVTFTAETLTKTMRGLAKAITAPKDIYVAGETTPRMLGKMMSRGNYISEQTGQPVRSIKDIDGPVLDRDGNMILSLEDIRQGLVDRNGNPIETLSEKAIDTLMGVGRMGLGALKMGGRAVAGLYKGAWNVASGATKATVGRFFGGKKNQEGTEDGEQTIGLLTQIRDILDTRLPANEQHREGSWQQTFAEREAEKTQEATAEERLNGGERVSIFERLKGLLPAGLFGAGAAGEEDEDDGDTIIGGYDGGDGDKKDTKGKRGKPKGRMGRAMSKAGRFLKKIPGVGLAGRLLGKIPGVGMAGRLLGGAAGAIGRVGSGALGLLGSTAARSALLAGGSALLSGLGTAGAAIGSVLASPVVLTAAAIGGLAYGGYKLYQAFKDKQLVQYRIAQYGFNPEEDDNEDPVSKILELEERLYDKVSFDVENGAAITGRVNIRELMEEFGLDSEDQSRTGAFVRWFQGRFKPVFLAWCALLNKQAPEVELMDADDDLEDSQKVRLVKKVKEAIRTMDRSPFAITLSPFGNEHGLDATEATANKYYQKILDEFSEDKKDSTTADTQAKTAMATTALTATAGKGGPVGDQGSGQGQGTGRGLGSLDAVLAGVTVPAGAGLKGTVSHEGRLSHHTGRQGISALDAVRFKTYGLVALDIDKVRALQTLEEAVIEDLTFDRDGRASFIETVERYSVRFAEGFGVSTGDTDAIINWSVWFNSRFIPTLLNYATAIKQVSKSILIREANQYLNAEQKLDAAMAVYTSKGTMGGGQASVWVIDRSPWPGYVLNSDVKSVDNNLNVIKQEVRQKTLLDPGAKDSNKNQPRSPGQFGKQSPGGLPYLNKDLSPTAPQALQRSYSPTKRSNYEDADSLSVPGAGSGGYVMPAQGRISSLYGPRVHPITGAVGKMHKGIDIAAARGTPVVAAANGTIFRREFSKSYGNVIYIKHPDGQATRYAHMDRFQPGYEVGSEVRQGDIIGYVGNTGQSAGNHLHFEIRKTPAWDSGVVDPLDAIQGKDAEMAEKALKEKQKALKEEQRSDSSNPVEGLDTVQTQVTGKPRTEMDPGTKEAMQGKPPAPGDSNTATLKGPMTDVMGLAGPTATRTSKRGEEDEAKVADNRRREEERGVALSEAQQEQTNKDIQTSVSRMYGVLESSLETQRSIDGTLKAMNKSVSELLIMNKDARGEQLERREQQAEAKEEQAKARPREATRLPVRKNPVSLKRA